MIGECSAVPTGDSMSGRDAHLHRAIAAEVHEVQRKAPAVFSAAAPNPSPESGEIIAQLEHTGFKAFPAAKGMIKMNVNF